MVRIARSLALGLATLPLAACATLMPSEQPVSVTGSVTYRERLALPPTAQVEIRIDDVSLADAPSRTVARQSFTADGRPEIGRAHVCTQDTHAHLVCRRLVEKTRGHENIHIPRIDH